MRDDAEDDDDDTCEFKTVKNVGARQQWRNFSFSSHRPCWLLPCILKDGWNADAWSCSNKAKRAIKVNDNCRRSRAIIICLNGLLLVVDWLICKIETVDDRMIE